MRKFSVLFYLVVIASMLLAACAPAATPPPAVKETVVVTSVAEVTKVVTQQVVVSPTAAPATAVPTLSPSAPLPRNQTLYFNGQQWNAVVCWNPYSSNCNNAMAISQGDSARVTMFETPYLYNMLDGKVYPLLADGPFAWNDAHTEITFKIKPAAQFEHYYFTIGAALSGLGACVVPWHLVADEVTGGRLVAPFGFRETGYRYILRSSRPADRKSARFSAWLRDEAARASR